MDNKSNEGPVWYPDYENNSYKVNWKILSKTEGYISLKKAVKNSLEYKYCSKYERGRYLYKFRGIIYAACKVALDHKDPNVTPAGILLGWERTRKYSWENYYNKLATVQKITSKYRSQHYHNFRKPLTVLRSMLRIANSKKLKVSAFAEYQHKKSIKAKTKRKNAGKKARYTQKQKEYHARIRQLNKARNKLKSL